MQKDILGRLKEKRGCLGSAIECMAGSIFSVAFYISLGHAIVVIVNLVIG